MVGPIRRKVRYHAGMRLRRLPRLRPGAAPLLSLCLASLLALLMPAGLAAQPAPAGTCGAILAAGERRLAIPHHVYTEQTQAGTTRAGEIISMPDAQYLLIQGQWMRSPLSLTLDEALEEHRARFREARTYSCRKLRNESVNGELAEVYQLHSETDEGISDGQIWIAQKTGLPMKQEVDLQVLIGTVGTAGSTDKSHTSARFDYANVQKPATVVEP